MASTVIGRPVKVFTRIQIPAKAMNSEPRARVSPGSRKTRPSTRPRVISPDHQDAEVVDFAAPDRVDDRDDRRQRTADQQ